MGKQEADVLGEPPSFESTSCCCSRKACKWLIPVVLGLYVLAFAIWSIHFRQDSNDSQPPSPPPWRPHVEASFRLHKSALEIQKSLPQLQLDLQNEIGIPDTQIEVISIAPLSNKNLTEVQFNVSPDLPSDLIAPVELSLLRETFVELFMQRAANLSLTSSVFGAVSHFEVLQFPGGITVVPPQPGFPLSKVFVLFNFTLHNSLSHIHRNFAKFRLQLANGIVLKPNETLFVQLTNLEGSTVKSPVVVQTSILPVVGAMLPSTRLKQLAWEIIDLPRSNLGLNHTLFGRVRSIKLSSFLENTLESAPTPSPSPSPAPAPAPNTSPDSSVGSRSRGSKRHWQHLPSLAPADAPYYRYGTPTFRRLAPAPQQQQVHGLEGPLAPSFPPSPVSPSNVSPSPFFELPRSPNFSPIVPSGQLKSPPVESPGAADDSSARHPFNAPASVKAPSEAGLRPGIAPSPSQLHERMAYVPVGSSRPTSAGIIMQVPVWIIVISIAFWIGVL